MILFRWANVAKPRNQAIRLAKHLKCPDTSSGSAIVDCLRKVSGSDLIEAQNIFIDWSESGDNGNEPMNLFSPRSDPESDNPFLPLEPIVAMKRGIFNGVPYMLGYAEKEGIWRANYVAPEDNDSHLWKKFVANFRDIGPLAFGIRNQTDNEQEVLDKLIKFYKLEEMEDPTEDVIEAYVDAQSESMFTYGIDVTTKLMSQHIPTYFYYLTYPGYHSLALLRKNQKFGDPKYEALKKATHGTDMLLMFPMFPFPDMPQEDIKVSRHFNKLLVDFAQNGKSTSFPDWTAFSEESPSILVNFSLPRCLLKSFSLVF